MGVLEHMKYTREPTDLVERELISHCLVHGTSFLAASEFEEDHALRVHPSEIHAGMWYLGVVEVDVPVYRDSEYFPNEEEAQAALNDHTWTQRMDA